MKYLGTMIAATAGAVALATPAAADPRDDRIYYDTLTYYGMDCDSDYFDCREGPEDLISFGHSICKVLRNGMPEVSLIAQLAREKPSFDARSAQLFVEIAESVYCQLY